jgi:hypothetical protein
MKFEGKTWKENSMRSDPAYRIKVFKQAAQKSREAVEHSLQEACPPRADSVVHTARQMRDDIVEETDSVKGLLHEIATFLKRTRGGKGSGTYRFGGKTKCKPDPPTEAGEGMFTTPITSRSPAATPGVTTRSKARASARASGTASTTRPRRRG